MGMIIHLYSYNFIGDIMRKNKKKDNSFINSKACTKLLLLICIFLIGCIVCKNNVSYRSKIYDRSHANK